MTNTAPKSNGISRIATIMLMSVVIGMALLFGWQALLDSGLLLIVGLIGVVILLMLLREGLNFVLGSLFGRSERINDAQTPANDMAGQIGRSLKAPVKVASMEDTGQYIHVMLHIGAEDEQIIEELVVIPHAYLYDPAYWDQMTQGIINYNRQRIPA